MEMQIPGSHPRLPESGPLGDAAEEPALLQSPQVCLISTEVREHTGLDVQSRPGFRKLAIVQK